MMSHPYVDAYPYLDALVGGWFHQDFDLDGDTLEDLIDAYKKGTPPDDLGGARADIKRFLRQTPRAEIEQAFVRLFNPGVDPKRWAASVEEWLSEVYRLLSLG